MVQQYNSFDLIACPQEDLAGGVRARIYYAPQHYFKSIDLPASGEVALAPDAIQFDFKKGWSCIDVLIDEADLQTKFTGGRGKSHPTSSLAFFVLGFRPAILKWALKMRMEKLVFLVIDGIGQQWLLGNLRSAAMVDQLDFSSEKKYEGNPGMSVSVGARCISYAVQGDSTQAYIGDDWVFVLADHEGTPILFNNNTMIEI